LNPLQATENPNGVAENAGQSIEVFGDDEFVAPPPSRVAN
jgi:hypothetical protein